MKQRIAEWLRLVDDVPPLLFALLTFSVIAMNLLANKSIDTGLEWLALDTGILFSWLTFLCMDVTTHCYGPKVASAASLSALGINLFAALMFFIASRVPGAWGESFIPEGGDLVNAALNNTIGGTWFVILGSSIAFAVSALFNNFLNWGIGEKLESNKGFGSFALRSYVSTISAQFVDNIVFALLVSRTFFGWTPLQCFTCALTGAFMELFFEVVFSPFGYRISQRILDNRSSANAQKA